MRGPLLGILALGCGRSVVIPIHGHGGSSGVRLQVEGTLTGTAVAPGAPQSVLDAQITFPAPFWLCPASSVVWARQELPTWNVLACAPGADLVWAGTEGAGAVVEKVELEYDETTSSVYVSVTLDRAPYALWARTPMAPATATTGTVTAPAQWECFCGGSEIRTIGEGTLRLDWAFDPAVARAWTGTGRGH